MAKREGRLRVTVLCEDRRTENFVRRTLESMGIERRDIRYETAPSGRGAAEAWVLVKYPREVRILRAKNFQADLALVAIRDGDAVGVARRKAQLDEVLEHGGMSPRGVTERISTPVPTWAIENWLLALLHHEVDEARGPAEGGTWKDVFERSHGNDERSAIQTAAAVFVGRQDVPHSLSSLGDGRVEFDRIHGQ